MLKITIMLLIIHFHMAGKNPYLKITGKA